jgi:acetyl esterase/lipase
VALTAAMKEPPTSLMLSPNTGRMLGVAGGDLWAIEVANGTANNLTGEFEPAIESVVHPTESDLLYRPVDRLVIKTGEKDSQVKEWFEVAIGDDRATTTPFPRPDREADLNLYRPSQRLVVFSAALADGTFVWTRGEESGSFSARFSFNEHLVGIAEGERRVFEYRGVEGDALKGFLLLPVGYQEGAKVPLAVSVYAGHVVRGDRESLAAKNSPIYLNLQLLAARGYAVLVPSMPLPPEGQAGDPYIDLPKGVMSAVDKVVEMGVADPGKLVVWGQSYGGYSTYTLVTYTQRFKAAVALAGLSELVSLYGILDARERYDRYPHEFPFAAILSESGQIRMGDTPWGDLWRYLRNSPLYYLDRVQTPLMIVQGDLDYVAIEQGELFFSGLHRLGKRAQFVRYWGDSHTLESPANIRDMWQRIFAWFDEHLSPKAPEQSGTPS